jgi:hypothetical protein
MDVLPSQWQMGAASWRKWRLLNFPGGDIHPPLPHHTSLSLPVYHTTHKSLKPTTSELGVGVLEFGDILKRGQSYSQNVRPLDFSFT